MIQSSVRSAGLALLLTVTGCGGLASSGTGAGTPGLNVAEAALQGGAAQIALQVSDGVLSESPNNTRAMEIKGDALSLLGDYDGAAAIFQALLAKDPNSVRANIGLGRIRLAKDPAAAEALFQQVLKREPRELTALNNLGIARDLQGRHAEAQPAYRQALAIDPNLESAQVNLALSMALTGRGAEAIQLLKAKASQPGAPTKVKHDYAAVLAMAGNRSEAERVLSDDLAPDEIRQMLDSVTGTHSRIVRDRPSASSGEAYASRQRDDDVPPDVVQVPERAPGPVARSRTAQIAPPTAAMAAALAAPAPMVVRPRPVAEPDSDTPPVQPVNPVAAAVTNQRPLALNLQSGAPVEPTRQAAAAPEIAVPEVVPLPRAQPAQRPASARAVVADVETGATPETPPPPVERPAQLPRSYRPVPTAERARPEPVPAHAMTEPRPTVTASAERNDAPAQTADREETSRMVQFAAVGSEESAHTYWKVLVHRFPDALGQREPVVIRFERGGTVFWRVRTEGFSSVTEAQTMCARMHAGGQDCFVPRS